MGLRSTVGWRAGVEEVLAAAGTIERDVAVAEHHELGVEEPPPHPPLAAGADAGVVDHRHADAFDARTTRRSGRSTPTSLFPSTAWTGASSARSSSTHGSSTSPACRITSAPRRCSIGGDRHRSPRPTAEMRVATRRRPASSSGSDPGIGTSTVGATGISLVAGGASGGGTGHRPGPPAARGVVLRPQLDRVDAGPTRAPRHDREAPPAEARAPRERGAAPRRPTRPGRPPRTARTRDLVRLGLSRWTIASNAIRAVDAATPTIRPRPAAVNRPGAAPER